MCRGCRRAAVNFLGDVAACPALDRHAEVDCCAEIAVVLSPRSVAESHPRLNFSLWTRWATAHRVPARTREYAQVRSGTVGYARNRSSMLQNARVCPDMPK